VLDFGRYSDLFPARSACLARAPTITAQALTPGPTDLVDLDEWPEFQLWRLVNLGKSGV
jgi:hypothetical protein